MVCGGILFDGRVFKVRRCVEFVVDELHENDVEIQESRHNPVVNIDRQVSWILEWNNISYFLSHDLTLVVNSLYAHEHLLKGICSDNVKLEVLEKLAAKFDFFSAEIELFMSRENSKQGH